MNFILPGVDQPILVPEDFPMDFYYKLLEVKAQFNAVCPPQTQLGETCRHMLAQRLPYLYLSLNFALRGSGYRLGNSGFIPGEVKFKWVLVRDLKQGDVPLLRFDKYHIAVKVKELFNMNMNNTLDYYLVRFDALETLQLRNNVQVWVKAD